LKFAANYRKIHFYNQRQELKNPMKYIFLLFWSFSMASLWAQNPAPPPSKPKTVVSGVIRDAKTKEPLSFANVYFLGSLSGINADMDGNYTIETEEKLDTLIFNYLGYDDKVLRISRYKTQTLDILLTSRENVLQTATVTASRKGKIPKDTFALEVWHQIIKHKAENQRPRSPYLSYKDYSKTQFDWYKSSFLRQVPIFKRKKSKLNFVPRYMIPEEGNAKVEILPCLMKETISQIHLRTEPRKRKETILADRFSGITNQSISEGLGVQLYEIDLYKNVIDVMGKSFISPFANTANITYRFFITDSLVKNGDTYYKMDFWGKSPQDLSFAGTAWIHAPTYAIEQASFEIPQNANINHVQRYKVVQTYTRLADSTWFRNYEHTEIVLAMFKLGRGRQPMSAVCRKIFEAYDVELNQTLPDSVMAGDKYSWKKGAFHANDTIWDTTRPTALNHVERSVYKMVDSIKVTPAFKRIFGGIMMLTTEHIPFKQVEFGRALEFVSWNAVEGTRLKLGVRTRNTFSPYVNLSGFVAYGTKDKGWKTGGIVSWNIPNKKNRWQNLRAEYRYDYTQIGNINRLMTYDNIITSLTRRTPLTKLMKMQTAELAFNRAWIPGFSNGFATRHRIYYATPDNGFDFSTGGQQILSQFSVSEAQVTTNWNPGELFFSNGAASRISLGSKLPVFALDYTFRYMDNFMGQNLTNHKLDFRVRHRWAWQLGYTRYNINASKIWGPAPYPLMTIHQGNGSYMYNRNAFNLMNEFEFISDTYASLMFAHHFDGFFLNKIPLIRKLKFREIFTFNALYGNVSQSNLNLLPLPNDSQQANFYAEIGFGIENIAEALRVDFIWRLTHLNNPNSIPFGIKLSFAPKF